MKNKDFCHLHIHNEYSQLDGFGTSKAYAQRASGLGFKYLGLTNHGNIDGLIKFQKDCREYGIIPILGCEGYIIPDNNLTKKSNKRGHICLWVKNQTGFENLCKLLTFANIDGFYYRPRFTYSKLLECCEGLVISTACMISWTNVFINGIDFFYELKDSIGDDLYCEIMPHATTPQINFNKKMLKLSKHTGNKIIVTNDCHYIDRSDWKAQEILLAIQRKAKWTDKNRWKFNIRGLHLRTWKEMESKLRKIGMYKRSYLHNTLEIAEKCGEYEIPRRQVKLPRVKGKGIGLKEADFLKKICYEGFKNKFGQSIKANRTYNRRFLKEFKLIKRKKFIRYFLIVWEFVDWCRENNILLGPGRGSVGASLIAYLIGITSVDPIKYNLIFDRFINEDRIDFPDIDIDFEHSKRHLAQQHLETVYGKERVANVSSFNRMKARAVIKDVSRVFEVPDGEVNRFTKLIEDNDDHTGIQEAIETYEEGREFQEKYPVVVKYAKHLEGQVRGYSQHAAAIVLSQTPIGDSGRCNLISRKDTILVNWEKDDTEYAGLMKLDALGLKLLSILSETKKLVKKNHDYNIDFENLNLDDSKVYKDLSNGNTTGIFQLTGYATTSVVKEMGVEKFMDISAVVSLSRPGPAGSGMTEEYIRRKHGKKWERKHKVYERITEDTYGLLVYQEQVMAVINEVAGLPYNTTDKIRKIIGKKRDPKEFAKYKKQFIKGCKKERIFSVEEAKEFWRGLQRWAKYGFNRAHAVEYAMLAYWCSWLKNNFPTEFLCASLTYSAKEKKPELVEEAYRLGLTLVLPKVNISDPMRWTSKEKKLHIPFIEVKGLGVVKAKQASVSENNKSTGKWFGKRSKQIPRHKGSLGELLEKIGAYDINEKTQISKEVKSKFDFRVVTNPKDYYRRLYELYDNKIRLDRLDQILEGERKYLYSLSKRKTIIRKRRFKGFDNLLRCTTCSLIEECNQPVPPSSGRYNIMMVGQDPGFEEDKEGIPFCGRSGELIWKKVKARGYERDNFHVTNVNKCYPKHSKKSSEKQIKVCGKKWLKEEIKEVKPIVILAFGASALYFFTGKKGGITDMSGKVTWDERIGAWIVWCLHPAATLHNPDSKHLFNIGMKRFFQIIKALGLQNKS